MGSVAMLGSLSRSREVVRSSMLDTLHTMTRTGKSVRLCLVPGLVSPGRLRRMARLGTVESLCRSLG